MEKCHQLIEHHVQDFQLCMERIQSSNLPSIVGELQEAVMKTNSEHKSQLAHLGQAELPRILLSQL
jgi:hypothetical protein